MDAKIEPEAHEGITEEHHEKDKHHSLISSINSSNIFFAAMLIVIIAITILVRSGMLQYQGLFEPDGFFHYSVVLQSIANHYVVPMDSSLSGFVTHNYISEPTGLYYMTLIPYFFLHFFGVTAMEIMRHIAILFGILDGLGAYFLAKRLSNSRNLGLLAFMFVAVSSGDIARTAGMVYRGDTFVTFFTILALLLLLKSIDEKGRSKYLYAVLSAFVLSLTGWIWNGAPFGVVVYIAAIMLLALYAFIFRKRDLSVSCLVVAISMLFWYALINVYTMLTLIREQEALTSVHFFLFYVPIVIGILLSIYITDLKAGRLHDLLSTPRSRTILVAAFILLVVAVIYIFYGSYLSQLLGGGGGVIANNNVGSTTQELQKPTWQFIWASFSYEIILAPLGLMLFIFMHWMNKRHGKEMHGQSQICAFGVVLVYFMATMWLQINALRYNSLVAVPIAIFAAYFVYMLGKIIYEAAIGHGWNRRDLIAYFIMGSISIVMTLLSAMLLITQRAPTSALFLVAAVASLGICIIGINSKRRIYFFYVFLIFMLLIIALCTRLAYLESISATQADGITPQFLQAVTWLRNNTPANATVLALWPDGSVVEGWGNRQSYLDSVGGELEGHITNNSQFVINSTPDQQYLYSIGKPEYLIARDYWFAELAGIAVEANVSSKVIGNYGYNELIGNRINEVSNSTVVYSFYTQVQNTQGQTGYVELNATVSRNLSGDISANAIIESPGTGTAPQYIKSIIFYNESSGTHAMYNYTGSSALNYTLVITVANRTITNAILAGPDLTNSNMFKWLIMCSYQSCPYGNSNVSMHMVYENSDSKIFKIVYS